MKKRKGLGRQIYREDQLLDNPHTREKVEQRKEENEKRKKSKCKKRMKWRTNT
jgi:hypothetical protein